MKKIVYFCGPVGKGTKHDAPVGDGFVPGDGYLAFQAFAFAKFHVSSILCVFTAMDAGFPHFPVPFLRD